MANGGWSAKVSDFTNDVMTISGKEIPIKRGLLHQGDLIYWSNNPRIYSIVHGCDEPLDQDEIQVQLQSMDHVKTLRRDIEHHGGIIEPIIVLDESFEVIEGNSRLAAIRFLCQRQPIKFGKVRSAVLPADTDEKIIYSYLNQEHIQGKTRWSPYEEAGVVYRLVESGMTFPQLATELNITEQDAKKKYGVYEFMVRNDEDKPNRYSYYDVYLTNRKAKKRRQNDPKLDERIVEEIRSEILTAQDFRSMLPHVCEDDKQFNNFVSGKRSLLGAYETLEKQGKTEDLVRKLKRMHDQVRNWSRDDFDSLAVKAQKDAEYRLTKLISDLKSLKESVFGN